MPETTIQSFQQVRWNEDKGSAANLAEREGFARQILPRAVIIAAQRS
jgi:hypothetical protein